MSHTTTTDNKRAHLRRARQRKIARIDSLERLVGSHPDALRDIYAAAPPFDPRCATETAPRLLAVPSLRAGYMLTRPLVVALSKGWMPWRTTRFESGGTAGQQGFVLGGALRFSAAAEPSRLDERPTLRLSFADLGNNRMLSKFEQELRWVGDTVAMGPLFRGNGRTPLAWLGFETRAATEERTPANTAAA